MIRFIKNFVGWLSGFGKCFRCGDYWNHKTFQCVPSGKEGKRGGFALCQECFWEATRGEIIAYHYELVLVWRKHGTWVTPVTAARFINEALHIRGFEGDWSEPWP